MSTRGANFRDRWLTSNLSGLASSDVILHRIPNPAVQSQLHATF
ncbi:hypothetical protein C7I87_32470 [Mesorhizobium sp. SARCC-RB16n]|nr:hypothetical protein C7I87_32470 [Mesorhizobium sp. SARCC-RB16n]